MKRDVLFLFFLSVFLVTSVFSDDESLEGNLQNLYEDVAKGYTNPIITGFGTRLNGGWFHSAPRSTVLGVDLEYGLVLMGSFFPAGESTFEAKGNIQFGRNDCETITSFLVGDSLEFIREYLIESIMAQDIQVKIFGPTIIGVSEDSIQIIFPGQYFIIIIPEEGENHTRLTVGASFRVAIVNLNIDYNLGKYKSVTGGLSIGITF